MSQTLVVTRLAVRELWITFRMLLLLAVYVGVGAAVALVPAPPTVTLGRLSIGLGVAMVVGTAVAAEAIATERVLGRAGWLVTRSIARGTLLAGWFLALAALTLVGVGAAGTLGWLAITAPLRPAEPLAYVAVITSAAAQALVGVGAGLVIGSILRPLPASMVAVIVAGLGVVGSHLLLPDASLPLRVLADLADMERPLTAGVRATGIGLGVAAAATVLARLALSRAEL